MNNIEQFTFLRDLFDSNDYKEDVEFLLQSI